jgi:hypothetical protein
MQRYDDIVAFYFKFNLLCTSYQLCIKEGKCFLAALMEDTKNILLSYICRQNHYISCLILTGVHNVELRHFTEQTLVPSLGSLPASAGTLTYASTWLHGNIYCAHSSWLLLRLPRSKAVGAKLMPPHVVSNHAGHFVDVKCLHL